jgi:hypothetical protein
MSKTTCLFLLAAILAITSLFTNLRLNGSHVFFGDTAQLYLILEHLHQGLGAYNPVQPSVIDFQITSNLGNMTPAEICAADLNAHPYIASQFNHFKFHSYFILYPLSFILNIFSSEYTIHWVNFFAFTSFIFIIFYILRESKVNTLYSFLIIFLVSLHPCWSWAIQGQPYVDRWYLPFGILIFYFIQKQKSILTPAYVFILLSSLLVEKVLIYNSLFIFIYSILFYQNKNIFISRITIGFISFASFYLLVNYYIVNGYYSSAVPTSLGAVVSNLSWPGALNGVASLLIVNLPFLLPALIFRPKLFLIAGALLVPNLVGNIGGAEKVGFMTHYHTLYFPFVTYAFICSAATAFHKFNKSSGKILILGYITLASYFYSHLSFQPNNAIALSRGFNLVYLSDFYKDFVMVKKQYNEKEIIKASLPANAMVSSVEQGMPFAYQNLDLHIYPLNLDKADFLVLHYKLDKSKYSYSGYFGYLGQEHNNQVDACLETRLEKSFDTKNPIILNQSLAILKRRQSQ